MEQDDRISDDRIFEVSHATDSSSVGFFTEEQNKQLSSFYYGSEMGSLRQVNSQNGLVLPRRRQPNSKLDLMC